MPRSWNCDAIVLHAYDIGEADRFCILLTEERGRIPARARGARKPSSRMGGSLLPLRRVRAEVEESEAGWYVRSAACSADPLSHDLRSFLLATQGAELLLGFLEDDHPVPEVFAAFARFLDACANGEPSALLAFQCRLLHVLGILPETESLAVSARLSPEERRFAAESAASWSSAAAPLPRLQSVVRHLLGTHAPRPLKAAAVAGMMEQ